MTSSIATNEITQVKLSKREWEGIEIPVSKNEDVILNMIINGFSDPHIIHNQILSLIDILRIGNNENLNVYLYDNYIYPHLKSLDIPGLNLNQSSTRKIKLNSTDKTKLQHAQNIITDKKDIIVEFILIDLLSKINENIKASKDYSVEFYTMCHILDFNIPNLNSAFTNICSGVCDTLSSNFTLDRLVYNGVDLLENNTKLLKCKPLQLYNHQEELFKLFNKLTPEKEWDYEGCPKLVLYNAPTATGKTLSPLGLLNKYKIVFVCAARHVGLQLAKSAVSKRKKIALAFNCKDQEDIRLHYNSVSEDGVTRDKRSGRIKKVDNTKGNKVEMIISDVKSYLHAMRYMMAFNSFETKNILLYWDEPTVTLDNTDHPLHEQITTNWKENTIPNIVLSSATLPKEHEIGNVVASFRRKFSGGRVHTIVSDDCKKSIPILNLNNEIIMPHNLYSNPTQILRCANHLLENLTILRYMDLQKAIDFIEYLNTHELVDDDLKLTSVPNEGYSEIKSYKDITMRNIKVYYLRLLLNINRETWENIFEHFKKQDQKYTSTRDFMTKDSYTLTNGPAIYLAEDVNLIAKFALKTANIPKKVMTNLYDDLNYNSQLNEEIVKKEKLLEDKTSEEKDKNKKMESDTRLPPEVLRLREEIESLKRLTRMIHLHNMFVPNKKEHLEFWLKENPTLLRSVLDPKSKTRPFVSNVPEKYVMPILQLDSSKISDEWKVLLLMGIGVFSASNNCVEYVEIMKTLAQEQLLYLIVASSNYIYGTNYQFCHAYLAKDLNVTQEKIYQSFGRVGRGDYLQNYTIRLRNDDVIPLIYLPSANKPEVINMNRFFSM